MKRPIAVGTRQACPPQGGPTSCVRSYAMSFSITTSAPRAPRAPTLLDIFNATAIHACDRLAIDATDAVLTYGELADAARGFAGRPRLTRVLPQSHRWHSRCAHDRQGRIKTSSVVTAMFLGAVSAAGPRALFIARRSVVTRHGPQPRRGRSRSRRLPTTSRRCIVPRGHCPSRDPQRPLSPRRPNRSTGAIVNSRAHRPA